MSDENVSWAFLPNNYFPNIFKPVLNMDSTPVLTGGVSHTDWGDVWGNLGGTLGTIVTVGLELAPIALRIYQGMQSGNGQALGYLKPQFDNGIKRLDTHVAQMRKNINNSVSKLLDSKDKTEYSKIYEPLAKDWQKYQHAQNLVNRIKAHASNNDYQSVANELDNFTQNFSNEEKIEFIKNVYNKYNKFLDLELKNNLIKQYAGAGLQIASAAIPFSGTGKIGAKIGEQFLKFKLGKKISQNIGAGIASGSASGGLFGIGEGISDDNLLSSVLMDITQGAILGGTIGTSGAYIEKWVKELKLRNTIISKLYKESRKNFRNFGKQYYYDYLNGTQIKDPFGNTINFPNSQFGEIRYHNYKMLPNIKKQIKTAKGISKSNDKPNRLDSNFFNKLYNDYNGKKYEYIIINNSNNMKYDFYQIKEVGSNPAYSNQARALELEPNYIINYDLSNFNPTQSGITFKEYTELQKILFEYNLIHNIIKNIFRCNVKFIK